MQAHSEYRHMNNLSCHNPTGNVLGIYILSSRALDEPSQQSNTWHILSPRPFAQSKATGGGQENVSVAWICIYTLRKQKLDEHARWWLSARRGGLWITQWSPAVAAKRSKRWRRCEGSEGHARGLTSHNGSSVYSRQVSFLPTIMREIESQEMFVFLSIRPNNNIIPKGLQKHLSSKDRPEN